MNIWIDDMTGLPVHNHGRVVSRTYSHVKNGTYMSLFGDTVISEYKPCRCGKQIFDISLSAANLVKQKKERE